MLFYLIRHADPVYSPDSLTKKGERQAEAVGRRLAAHGMDRIYSSPLQRAKDTAKPLGELLGKPVEIEDWAYECWPEFAIDDETYGKRFCMGLQSTKFLEYYSLGDEWQKMDLLKTSDAKNGWERITKAADEFFERHGYRRNGRIYDIVSPNDQKIALFCHAGLASVLMPYMLNIPPHIFWASFSYVNHTGVSVFQFKNNKDGVTSPRCLCMSDISHFYGENLPYQYCNEFYL